ncbi:hypothetical protein FRACYDRAFT_238358 [Fragilariopsis cylindrus CCMP1102]|uniref:Phytanoyl-CoA dioxygenase n=1 Tax=Fragilariopsis cylindrus CCMP1102 TaxID=635003 RepID=A0A1E7FIE4_9STRA|nr:hypothetical protein FRACYDRAFT_238358 [Fragilariopsis cylindrus CCMP1102]|eukprot:OEU17928.1 hypothetical protein FRACYDRAFT_238358 [Fragilariopsis cylindrus CCMP1102]
MNHYKVLLPRPATCPNDCIVGPTDLSEVIVSSSSLSSSWGKRANSTRKRKHNDDNNDNNAGTNSSGNIDGSSTNFAADTNNSFQTAIQTFLSSGCCVIPGGRRKRRSNESTTNNLPEELSLSCLPPEFVDICLHRAKTDYMYLNNLLKIEREKIILTTTNKNSNPHHHHQHHHKLTAVTRQDYSELCARDGGRIDIRYKMKDYPYNCGGLIYNTIVYPLLQELLNGTSSVNDNNDNENNNEPIQLVYAGVMWGMPIDIDDNNNNNSRSSDDDDCFHPHHQKWHADGGHLFSQAQQDQLLPPGFTLPPHCINVFYPLVDLTQENGPTEFRIGSHRRRDNVEDKALKEVEFPLLCPAGGAVLFDYRIQHRGRANVSSCSSSSTATSTTSATTPFSTTTKLNTTAEGVAEVIAEEEKNTPPPTSSTSSTTSTGTTKAEMEIVNKGRPVLYLAYAKTWFKDHGNTRSGRRLCPKSSSSSSSNSASRTLTGQPVPYGKGFENYDTTSNSDNTINDADCDSNGDGDGDGTGTNNENDGDTNISNGNDNGVGNNENNSRDDNDGGEPWMLFQMTVELPNNKLEIIRVHKGDIAVEVSQQFCYKHSLSDDFISILTQTIQQQMNECML